MLFYDNSNIGILEMKAAAQETEFEYTEAISTYERLHDITSDFKYAVNISKILVEDSNLKMHLNGQKKLLNQRINPNQEGKGEAVSKSRSSFILVEVVRIKVSVFG